jgi:hypothetical protein
MLAINTIQFNNNVINVSNKQRPFSNDFVVKRIQGPVRTRNGRDAVEVVVQATPTSIEPYRVYYCVYTLKGTLLSCIC